LDDSGHYDGRPGFWARGSVPEKAQRWVTTEKAQRRLTINSLTWEEKIFFQADLNGVFVTRKASDRMINGTKLLEASSIAPKQRDHILRMEKRNK
jgi:hypothetical protein